MKKNLFILFIFAALVSCSDLAPEDSLAADLPKDFKVSEYSEINPDIVTAQLAITVRDTNLNIKTFPGVSNLNWQKIADCANFLKDTELVEDIYLNYIGCPKKGWNRSKPCEGQGALYGWNNPLYSTESSCAINGCWPGGWDDPPDERPCKTFMECEEMGLEFIDATSKDSTLKDIWDSKVAKYENRAIANDRVDSIFSTFTLICNFNLYQEDAVPSSLKDREFIESFVKNKLDSNIIVKHFTMAGRYEGRPYKYCGSGEADVLRNADMAVVLDGPGGKYYDYSANLFCLNKSDAKVYKIK